MKQLFWLMFTCLIFSGLHRVQVHLKLLMHKICSILYVLYCAHQQKFIKSYKCYQRKYFTYILKCFVVQLAPLDIFNRDVYSSNLNSNLISQKYFTFIIKLNNKIGNRNKMKINLSYIVIIDYSRLSLLHNLKIMIDD